MRKLIILLLLSTCLTSTAQIKFTLEGSVPITFNNNKIKLLVKDDGGIRDEQILNSTIKNQRFSFNGNIETPVKNAVIQIIAANGKINSLPFALDTGFNELSIAIKNERYGALSLKGKLSKSNFIKSEIDSVMVSAYASYRKSQNIGDGALALPTKEYHEMELALLRTLEQYPNDYYSLRYLFVLSRSASMLNYQKLILNTLYKLSDNLQKTELANKLVDILTRYSISKTNSKVGQRMFDFEIKNLVDNRILASKDLIDKPYILAFSASWCVPCHEQLPHLIKMYEKYKSNGLQVIYYSVDDKVDDWLKYINNNNLAWINAYESKSKNSIASKLGVTYVPNYFIVNKKGEIIYNSDQMDDSLELLETYIKKAM